MHILLIPSLHGEKDLYLNLIYIGEFLLKKGYEVTIFDVNKYFDEEEQTLHKEDLERDLKEVVRDVDIVGISSYKMHIQSDKYVFNIIRSVRKDMPIVLGGWGPTIFPEAYLNYFGYEKVVIARGVHGQGLKAFIRLVQLYEKYSELSEDLLRDIKSVVFKDRNGNIVKTPLEDILDPSEIPHLDWNIEKFGLNPEDYVMENSTILVPVLCALASCPKYYKSPCKYCTIGRIIREYEREYGREKFWREIVPKLTKFDIERVVQDIISAYDYFTSKIRIRRFSITIVDDCTLPHVFERLLEKLQKHYMLDKIAGIKFQTRPEYVNKIIEIVRQRFPSVEDKLIIDVGIEFFSESDLNRMNRGYDNNIITHCLETLSTSRCKWTMYVILTTPFSTSLDFAMNIEGTLQWIDKVYLVRSNPYIFEEGTFLLEELDEDDFTYRELDGVKVPVRPRFKVDIEELEKMLELVDYYIDMLQSMKSETLKMMLQESDFDRKYKLFLKYQSIEDLIESLAMLRDALIEDIEHIQRRLSSSPLSNGALSS